MVEVWLRLHNMNIGGVNGDPSGTGKVVFDLFVEADTPEDPSQSFLAGAGGNGITIDSSVTAPVLLADSSSGPFGSTLCMRVSATQGATDHLGLMVDVSVDLVLKGA